MTQPKAQTVVYPIGRGLYVNLTNRCCCACSFCVRERSTGVGCDESGATNVLWLEHEPAFDEVMAAFEAFDMDAFDEVVFCGYGEPTCAWETLKQVAAEVKHRWGKPVRVNTNGQGSLINGRDIVPECAGIIDTLSISLNAPDAAHYQAVVNSRFGEDAFRAMLGFAREAASYVPHVVMTTVSTTISAEDEARCQEICEELGVRYRIRAFDGGK